MNTPLCSPGPRILSIMINLVKIKEYPDGTADYTFDYDADFEAQYRATTGAKIVRKANVGKYIRKLLADACDVSPRPTRKRSRG